MPYLAPLSDAVWNSTRIAIDYDRGNGPARREIEPLGLVLKAGIWYVVAGADGGQVRTYRISRVVGAEPAVERFERPAGFDLAGYWADAAEAFEREAPRIAVDVRVRPDRLDQLRARRRPRHGRGGRAAAGERTPTAGYGFGCAWTGRTKRRSMMLRAGRWVEVLGPPEVRARVASIARAIAERYAGDLA